MSSTLGRGSRQYTASEIAPFGVDYGCGICSEASRAPMYRVSIHLRILGAVCMFSVKLKFELGLGNDGKIARMELSYDSTSLRLSREFCGWPTHVTRTFQIQLTRTSFQPLFPNILFIGLSCLSYQSVLSPASFVLSVTNSRYVTQGDELEPIRELLLRVCGRSSS